jgi:hypothetical protein
VTARHESADPAKGAFSAAKAEILSRREASRRLLGMAATWHLDVTHPVWSGLGKQGIPAVTTRAVSKTQFLNVNQLADLASLSEAIVPGSTRAGVAGSVDLLLSVDSSEVQESFGSSLAAMGEEAKRLFGANLATLTPEQMDRILALASNAPEGTRQRGAFVDLKNWVVGVYYSSEIGMTELGWTPNRFFAQQPEAEMSNAHCTE